MPRSKTKVVQFKELPKCNLCGRDATHDSYMPDHRCWGYTCEQCFQLYGSTGGFRLEVAP